MSESRIILGGGCFWCTEAVFTMFKGVISVTPGYAGGTTKNPTYEQVCREDTGHAEVLEVRYDEGKISLNQLLEVFFEMHDPTTLNRQGADTGTQYRSIILYTDGSQRDTVLEFIKKLQGTMDKKIVTEVKRLDVFYPAEDYHKAYYANNPGQPYCSFVISPKVNKIKKEFKDYLK